MKKFDNKSAREFFKDLERIVNATLGPKYGIVTKLSSQKMYFNEMSVECKLEAIKTDTDKHGYTVKDIEMVDFERLCSNFGFKPEDYRCKVEINNLADEALLIGFRPKARKNKYLIEINGKRYVTSCRPIKI